MKELDGLRLLEIPRRERRGLLGRREKREAKGKVMKIEEIKNTISPYIYAGAIRAATSHSVEGLRAAIVHASGNEEVSAFLNSKTGDALMRLALAGLLSVRDLPALVGAQHDVRDELLISASAIGFDAMFSGLTDGARFLHDRLASEPKDEPEKLA
jgi:hypothetical protein